MGLGPPRPHRLRPRVHCRRVRSLWSDGRPRLQSLAFSARHLPPILPARPAASTGSPGPGIRGRPEPLIEYRWAERKLDRFPGLAAELVGLEVDPIVTHGSPGSRAAKQATTTIPIVIPVVGDPVASGLVASLSHPGGNVTGLVLQEFESTVKWMELLKQVAPRASDIGWLDVPGIEPPEVAEVLRQKEDGAAQSLGLTIHRVTVRGPNDLTQAFAALEQQGVTPSSCRTRPC